MTEASVRYRDFYRGRRVMVTGGLGFIGSSLAHHLVDLGADVLLVDGMIPDYGGNLFNIADIEGRVRVNISDARNDAAMAVLVIVGGLFSRLLISVFLMPALYAVVARPHDKLEV